MRENCTYGSMRGSRRKTAKSVLRVVEDRAGVPDKGRPALLYTLFDPDAMCAAGEPDGMYSLGGLRVKVENGRATLADVPYDPKAVVSNVAGSVALFPDCFRRFVRVTGWPLEEAVKACGFNQLRSLGIADRGEIAPGQIADLVLVDGDLFPVATIVVGEMRFSRRMAT